MVNVQPYEFIIVYQMHLDRHVFKIGLVSNAMDDLRLSHSHQRNQKKVIANASWRLFPFANFATYFLYRNW